MTTQVTNYLDNLAALILNKMSDEFDSHDFINGFIRQAEKEYIDLLYHYQSFRKLNAEIGKYLGNNQEKLGIEKNGDKEASQTNTGTLSENQKWKKFYNKK